MARVKCRCGEVLEAKGADTDRLTCPRCGAKIRVRRSPAEAGGGSPSDGYIRFFCPCGRRLKVRAAAKPEAGRCPDCGRVVPVPESAWPPGVPPFPAPGPGPAGPGARTEELDAADLERLERWARGLAPAQGGGPSPGEAVTSSHQAMAAVAPPEQNGNAPGPVKMEAGLRVCPRCGKPLHMSATVCRSCGEPVPRR